MNDQEIRTHLIAGALAGLTGLEPAALGKLMDKEDEEAQRLWGDGDRAGLVAHLAGRVATAARARVGT